MREMVVILKERQVTSILELIHCQQKQGKWEESLSSLRGFFGLETRTLEDDMRALMMKGKTKDRL